MADAMSGHHDSAAGSAQGHKVRHQQRGAVPASPDTSAAFAVLTDPVLWRSITALMTGWPFPVFQLWKQRVPKYKLHVPRWSGEAPTFPQKRGVIAHVAIIENNQRVLEMAYELLKVPRKLVLEPREIQLDLVASEALSFKHVMACAARYGRLEMLQWMAEMATKERVWWVWEEDLIAHALYRRDFTVMSYLKDEFPRETTRVPYQFLLQAVRDNDLELTKWYYEHECHLGSEEFFERRYVMDHAVSLEMLQLMHAHREVRCTTRAMDRAAEFGDLEMVKFLHENRDEGCTTDAMSSAAAKGHVRIVRFLHENRSEGCTTHDMNVAARNGHLEVVRFLHENRSEGCTKNAMDHAAENGHLEIVKFLHENRSEGCTKNAMDMAAGRGHLDIVKFLHENRSEGCSKYAMDMAAGRGRLDIVKFLHENRSEGCTKNAMDMAVRCGHTEVVEFLSENRTEEGSARARDDRYDYSTWR